METLAPDWGRAGPPLSPDLLAVYHNTEKYSSLVCKIVSLLIINKKIDQGTHGRLFLSFFSNLFFTFHKTFTFIWPTLPS